MADRRSTPQRDSHILSGLHKARVEFNQDPKRVGRIRVRIPYLHGVTGQLNYIEPEGLPWAVPCVSGIAGDDFGTYIIPPVGSYVWVMFLMIDNNRSDPENLVYLGSSYGVKPVKDKPMNSFTEDESMSMGKWFTDSSRGETPQDIFNGKGSNYPDRGVIFKSPKGHTILYDDTDGGENFTIIDRIGQVIQFSCPVSADDNKGNTNRRGLSSALTEDQLDVEDSVPYILIKSGLNATDPESTLLQLFRDKLIVETSNFDTQEHNKTEVTHKHTKSELWDGLQNKTTSEVTPFHADINVAGEEFSSNINMTEERIRVESNDTIATLSEGEATIIVKDGIDPEMRIRDGVGSFVVGDSRFEVHKDKIEGKVYGGNTGSFLVNSDVLSLMIGSSVLAVGSDEVNINAKVINLNGSEVNVNGSLFKVNATTVDCPGSEEEEEE